MYTVFLSGGIASGKSTVARKLVRLGATTIDLDQISREVLCAGSPTVEAIGKVFGADLVDPTTGELNRSLLAQRAFSNEQSASKLESIEIPAITRTLMSELRTKESQGVRVCVVEVPLLDRVESLLSLPDEIVCVVAPLELRRKRAIERGMTGVDFDRRVALQPTDQYLRSHATAVIENTGDLQELIQQVDAWWQVREGRNG